MAQLSLAHKVIKKHLAEGRMVPGEEIGMRMDQALLQDATGTLAWLEFEQMDVDRVRVKQATQYVDHNILKPESENGDDTSRHRRLPCPIEAGFSRPGKGIGTWPEWDGAKIPGQRWFAGA